jgi:type IV pilus assembly protein PilY1
MVYNNSLTPAALPSECAGEQDFIKLDTGFGVPETGPRTGFPNGLGRPRGIDIDANGTVDFVYAGDTLGNLFRFDLTSDDPADWDITKIFEAKYVDPVTSAETPQPITTQPIVIANVQADDGYIVLFGTGSYITVPDSSDTSIQSIYGIWDRLGPTLIDKDELVMQEYTNHLDAEFGLIRSLSSNPVDYTIGVDMGWYNDLDAAPVGGSGVEFPGERAIRNIQVRGKLGFVNSVIPRSETSCVSIAGGFSLSFCPDTGGLTCLTGYEAVFDLNEDGQFNFEDHHDVDGTDEGSDGIDNDNDGLIDEEDEGNEDDDYVIAGERFEDAVPTDASFIGNTRITQLSDKTLDAKIVNNSGGDNTGRLSWKQLIDE